MDDPLCNVYVNTSGTPRPRFMCYTDYGSFTYISQSINEKHFKGQMIPEATFVTHSVDSAYGQLINADVHFEKDTLCFSGILFLDSDGPFYVICSDDKKHNIDIRVYCYGPLSTSEGAWKVNFRIPGYADGVYKITDLEGTHEVVCGDIPEGINHVGHEKDTDSYDIQGRKLNDDARGIIIKDNRKVLKQ